MGEKFIRRKSLLGRLLRCRFLRVGFLGVFVLVFAATANGHETAQEATGEDRHKQFLHSETILS